EAGDPPGGIRQDRGGEGALMAASGWTQGPCTCVSSAKRFGRPSRRRQSTAWLPALGDSTVQAYFSNADYTKKPSISFPPPRGDRRAYERRVAPNALGHKGNFVIPEDVPIGICDNCGAGDLQS